jgi:zinc protease
MLMNGTKNRTREQIKDELDKLSSTLVIDSSPGSLSIAFSTKRPNFAALMSLLREVLREPTFPESELAILVNEAKQNIEKQMVDPQGLARNLIRRKLNPYPKDHVRYVETYEESLVSLKSLTRDALVTLYKDQLGANVAEVALVGDFDELDAQKLCSDLFAGWKSTVDYRRIPNELFKVKGEQLTLDTPDKENAVYVAGHTFPRKDTDADYPSLVAANYIFGASGFNSRLFGYLREKKGWCYSAGSMLRVDTQDSFAGFTMFAICNPQNIDNVERGAKAKLLEFLKDGVSADELEAAKKGLLLERKESRGSDATLAGTLRGNLHLNRTFAFQANIDKKISELTVQDVNRATSSVLRPDDLIIIRAGDFKKK